MAEVKGSALVKDGLTVKGNAIFEKGINLPYLEIIDEKAPGTDGGTFDAFQWQTRDLTTTVHNDFASSITLAASAGAGGQFIIPAGTYHIEASAPAHEVESHIARLADVTDAPGTYGESVVVGTAEYAPDTDLWEDSTTSAMAVASSAQTRSRVEGRFTLTRNTTLEIQHQSSATKLTDGFGVGANFYVTNNVFTVLKMWQVVDNS